METVLTFIQNYQWMISLIVQLALLLGMGFLLHRINATKRRLEQISGIVSDYVAAVTAEETAQEESEMDAYDVKMSVSDKNMKESRLNVKSNREEEENRLISAVLQEIFP